MGRSQHFDPQIYGIHATLLAIIQSVSDATLLVFPNEEMAKPWESASAMHSAYPVMLPCTCEHSRLFFMSCKIPGSYPQACD